MIKNDNVISGGHAPSPLCGSGSGSMNAVVTLMKDDIVFIRHFAGAASEIIQGNWSKMNFLSIRLSIIIFPISFIDDNFVTLLQLRNFA